MRIIKFRQRNINNEHLHYWGSINGEWVNPKIQDNYVPPNESEQYINLKDKNGVEIYEGDPIKTIGLYQDNFIVEYSDRSFELYDGKDGIVSDEHNIWDAYEIIKNH